MLERSLDSKLREEEKNHPLVPPPADEYVFAKEDSIENIIFEENQESQFESPLIKVGNASCFNYDKQFILSAFVYWWS